MSTDRNIDQLLKEAYQSDERFRKACDAFAEERMRILKQNLSSKELEQINAGWVALTN